MMQNMTVADVLIATNGTLIQGDESVVLNDICINSREVAEGDLFVPLIGEKVDAHRFITGALSAGAAATLTDRREMDGELAADKAVILVNDTLEALQNIGRYIRARVHLPVVAVTGSVGKTTTREMITAALATDKIVFHTEKNFNSQIGVPITLSKLYDTDEIAVLECGMSEPGQIHVLSDMVKPSLCVVTTIGIAHIEFLKTQENIRTEKLHIIDCMSEGGTLFLNGDDPMLFEVKNDMPCKTVTYGCNPACDFYAEDITNDGYKTYFTCVHRGEKVDVVLGALGKHNVGNALAAIAVALEAGIPMEVSSKGLADFSGQRQRIVKADKGYVVIDDTYNASTTSMKASIDVACEYPVVGKHVLVLGDMFELGEKTLNYHYEVGAHITAKHKNEKVVVLTVGTFSKEIAKAVEDGSALEVHSFETNEEAAAFLNEHLTADDVVLLKGSNGMHMNEIVAAICG